MTKPTKKQIQKWCNALRSGKYSQTIGTLQDSNGYCCLGVACKIFIPESKQRIKEDEMLYGYLPDELFYSPKWLKAIDSNFGEDSRTNPKSKNISLSDLNDSRGFSFDEIADVLEAVYIHEVLK